MQFRTRWPQSLEGDAGLTSFNEGVKPTPPRDEKQQKEIDELKGSYYAFLQAAWEHIDPRIFRPNWHIGSCAFSVASAGHIGPGRSHVL